ncbi:type II toxin-antitoxin system prevent-host-death family antitoxin [Patescibacteria group bacterium]|nr:type II toxin-antitoxin system prevent-host-death family antitoxin [Patescibacteria group bacterium]
MKEKFITTNELANDASKILRELKKGEGVVVLRYSDPVGVLVSYEDYKKLENLENEFVQECKKCIKEAKEVRK